MDAIFTILLFVAVVVVAAVLFIVWLIFSLARWLVSGMKAICSPFVRTQRSKEGVVRCGRDLCRAENPAGARFCRRCGRVLPGAERVAVRRAAMW